MFKKFDDTMVSGFTQLKTSVQKAMKAKLVEQFPYMEDYMDEIMPKKSDLRILKCQDHIEILVNPTGEFLFFRHRDGPFMPSLRLVHKYPFICPLMKVDKGAITFVLSGANIMCPGLTSKGGIMTPNLPVNSVVTIIAEGKEHALAVGLLTKTPEEIAKVNKGIAIENMHFLNDGLWRLKPVK